MEGGWGRRGGEQEWKANRSERWRWNTRGKAWREQKEICTWTVKRARKRSKDGATKRNKQKRQDRKGSGVKLHKQKDKERLTGQKGDCRNAYSITLILSFCAAAQHQCADYESIIWDWQPCCDSTACQTHSQPPPLVLLPSSHNGCLMKTEWLEEERSETWKNNRKHTHRLGKAGDGASAKKKNNKKRQRQREEWRGGVENMGSMQLQLRERFGAREYANSSFVWAVDWPLHRTPGGEGRGSSGLGRLCLARRPSQA